MAAKYDKNGDGSSDDDYLRTRKKAIETAMGKKKTRSPKVKSNKAKKKVMKVKK